METLFDTETKAFIAALNGDDEEAAALAYSLTAKEARVLLDALEALADIVEVGLHG